VTEDGQAVNHAEALLREFGPTSHSIALAPDDVLVEEGAEADVVFVVLSGRLDAITSSDQGEVVVGSVGAGQLVGEITVIAGGRRTATLRASEPTEVMVIGRADFEGWLADDPDAADAISAEARTRIDRTQVATIVAELVGEAEPALVQEVVDRVDWRRLEAGEVLFEEGDVSDAAYFIVAGRVRVSMDDDGTVSTLAELGRGEVVGELGLLDNAPRSATVRAVRDSTLAIFTTEVFEELVTRSPGLMLHLARGILTRLRRTPRRTVGRAASLTIAVTAPVDSAPMVAGVVDAVARFGTVKHLSSSRVDQLLNRPGISQAARDNVGVPRLAEFMHEADVGNDHVVLETDRGLTGWTRRAVHQADRLVIVCSPDPDPDERNHVIDLLDAVRDMSYVTVMLAVLHPAGAIRPRSTATWLRGLVVDEVVHLREGCAADIARLGRLASGNGVGLVLSGGGARGFAHIGVYRALVETGVPIDAVAGCSIGAPLAAGIATGLDPHELVEVMQRQFHNLLDYTLPLVSMVKGERISKSIGDLFGGWDIEDLWLPYYCVSTNLTQSRLELHRTGSTARAVRASVAIPGILPPLPQGDDLLVDGGVLNNLPFETMRHDGRIDTVIAVDVAPARGPRALADYGTSVSGFRALAASVRRAPTEYPSVAAVLLRSMLAGAVHNQRAAMSGDAIDLLLKLDLPGVALLDFERVAEVAEVGYQAAIDEVRAWADTLSWLKR
jgi:predicted acylesterase/phospholipase RssA/CRP-like cAMP-binding protein